jgi:GNAT superfamily N-acetyltransferase
VESVVSEHFGSPEIVSRGVLHDTRGLPGFVAEVDSKLAGFIQYRIEDNQCEVVVLISVIYRRGVGRGLLCATESIARQAGCDRLWLITTNNNEGAIGFYRALGWRQVAIYQGAVRESRKIKPEIPLCDEEGTAIEDEIEFEWKV